MRANVKNSNLWALTQLLVVALCVFAFSPFVLSPGTSTPEFFGLPRSLGLGLLVSLGFLVLLILGALFAPGDDSRKKD